MFKMTSIVSKKTNLHIIGTDNIAEHFEANIIFEDNKPVDEAALKYAMLKCCEDVIVLKVDGQLKSSPEAKSRFSENYFKTVETPKSYEEFLSYDTKGMGIELSQGSLFVSLNPLTENRIFCRVRNWTEGCETELEKALGKAYQFYNSLYRMPASKAYKKLSLNGMDFIRYCTENSVVYRALLEKEEKTALAQAMLCFANERGLKGRINLMNGGIEEEYYDLNAAMIAGGNIINLVVSGNMQTVEKVMLAINWYQNDENVFISFHKNNDQMDKLMEYYKRE